MTIAVLAPAPDGPVTDPAEFIERFRRLAFLLAGRFARFRRSLADEFESAALLALWKAARTYDPARGKSHKAHATFVIDFALRTALRADRRRARLERRCRRQLDDEVDGLTLADLVPDARGGDGAAEVDFADLVATVSRDAAPLVFERMAGATFEEMGQARGLSTGVAQRRFHEAARQLAELVGRSALY